MTSEQRKLMLQQRALRMAVEIGYAVIDSVKVAKSEGAPAGLLYHAMMSAGMSLDAFQTIMDLLVQAKRVYRYGHLYYHPDFAPDYVKAK